MVLTTNCQLAEQDSTDDLIKLHMTLSNKSIPGNSYYGIPKSLEGETKFDMQVNLQSVIVDMLAKVDTNLQFNSVDIDNNIITVTDRSTSDIKELTFKN